MLKSPNLRTTILLRGYCPTKWQRRRAGDSSHVAGFLLLLDRLSIITLRCECLSEFPGKSGTLDGHGLTTRVTRLNVTSVLANKDCAGVMTDAVIAVIAGMASVGRGNFFIIWKLKNTARL